MIKKTKNFMRKLLGANTGISSKRFIAIYGFFLIAFVVLINLFTGLKVNDYIFNGLVITVGAALGATSMELFGKERNSSSFDSTTTTTINKTNNAETPPSGIVER